MARSSIGPPAIGGKPGKGKAGGNWFEKHKMETYAGAGVGGILLLLYFKSHQSTPAATKGPAVFSGSSAAYDSLEAQISRLQGQHGPHGKTPRPSTGPPPKKGKPPLNKKGHCPPGYFWDPDDNGGKGRCVKKAGHKGPDHGKETSTRNGSLLQANRGAKSGAQPTNLVTSIEHTLAAITAPTAINSKKRRRPVVSAPIRRINKPIRKAV